MNNETANQDQQVLDQSRPRSGIRALMTGYHSVAVEQASHPVSVEDFKEAADVMLELWNRRKSSTGLTALFCLCWAMDPGGFAFPVTRVSSFDEDLSLAWVRLVNGVMLGHGTFIEALIQHLGEEMAHGLTAIAEEQLAHLNQTL